MPKKPAPKKPAQGKAAAAPGGSQEVDQFLSGLDHPLTPALRALRAVIRAAHPGIGEGIKWKAPSFHYKEYFATAMIRSGAIMVILHRGAKVRDDTSDVAISDPERLLQWHAADRASATFASLQDVREKQEALRKIVKAWVRQM
jgi:hypothetical protein